MPEFIMNSNLKKTSAHGNYFIIHEFWHVISEIFRYISQGSREREEKTRFLIRIVSKEGIKKYNYFLI